MTTEHPIYRRKNRVMSTEYHEKPNMLRQKVTHEEYARLIKNSDVYYDTNRYLVMSLNLLSP